MNKLSYPLLCLALVASLCLVGVYVTSQPTLTQEREEGIPPPSLPQPAPTLQQEREEDLPPPSVPQPAPTLEEEREKGISPSWSSGQTAQTQTKDGSSSTSTRPSAATVKAREKNVPPDLVDQEDVTDVYTVPLDTSEQEEKVEESQLENIQKKLQTKKPSTTKTPSQKQQ